MVNHDGGWTIYCDICGATSGNILIAESSGWTWFTCQKPMHFCDVCRREHADKIETMVATARLRGIVIPHIDRLIEIPEYPPSWKYRKITPP